MQFKKVSMKSENRTIENGSWRYRYGNMFYVQLVCQDFATSIQFDDELVQLVMNEALKYEGWRYVFGGDNPNTSFDCSGLTMELPKSRYQFAKNSTTTI